MIYGANRLLQDLTALNYEGLSVISDSSGQAYLKISGYEVELGRFAGQIIDLAIPVPQDYPRTVGSSIHICSEPQLLEKQDSIPNVRNITDSNLGAKWRYWSFRFLATENLTSKNLMEQINGVFRNI